MPCFFRLLTITVFTFSSFTAQASEVVQFAKINSVIADIVSQVISNDDFVQSSVFAFDEAYSDLDKDQLKLKGQATLAGSAWSKAPTTMSAEFSYARLNKDPYIHNFFLKLDVTTDVFSLSTFALAQLFNNACADKGDLEPLEAIICKALAQSETAKDLADIVRFEATLYDEVTSYLDTEIPKLKAQLNAADAEQKAEIENELSQLEDVEKWLSAVERRVTYTDDGEFQTYQLQLRDEELADFLGIERLVFSLDANQVSVTLIANSDGPITDAIYESEKPKIQAMLLKLQSADADEKKSFASFVGNYLEIFKALATSER